MKEQTKMFTFAATILWLFGFCHIHSAHTSILPSTVLGIVTHSVRRLSIGGYCCTQSLKLILVQLVYKVLDGFPRQIALNVQK